MGENNKNLRIIGCAKIQRDESHYSHVWTLQLEDDSPEIIQALCPGHTSIRW